MRKGVKAAMVAKALWQRVAVKSSRDMEGLGAALAKLSQRGDVIALTGEVGAGKSVCVSWVEKFPGFPAVVLALMQEPEFMVPSPSFLLQHSYSTPRCLDVHHYDFYRLDEVLETDMRALGLHEALQTGICLFEWPDRLPKDVLAGRSFLQVTIELKPPPGGSGAQGSPPPDAVAVFDFDIDTPRSVAFASTHARWEGLRL